MTFSQYLLQKYSPSTVNTYLHDLKRYFSFIPQENARHATYSQIMEYVGSLRSRHLIPLSINRSLYALKAWYFYLIRCGIRKDHPCRYVKLKDAKTKPLQLQDLFTPAELEELLNKKERFYTLALRNQVIISLLIYQGLTSGELCRLEITDIDLEKGEIRIKPSAKQNGRTLSLHSKQIMLFYQYINGQRLQLLKERSSQTFILSMRGTPESAEGIGYFVETLQGMFPTRKLTAHTIRSSVIANMLKSGTDLRIAQVFAGHKKISSTERYRQSASEELKAAIQKYHPLNSGTLA